jgi:hypothetical protein
VLLRLPKGVSSEVVLPVVERIQPPERLQFLVEAVARSQELGREAQSIRARVPVAHDSLFLEPAVSEIAREDLIDAERLTPPKRCPTPLRGDERKNGDGTEPRPQDYKETRHLDLPP